MPRDSLKNAEVITSSSQVNSTGQLPTTSTQENTSQQGSPAPEWKSVTYDSIPDKIPSDVTDITFSRDFNESVVDVVWPQGLES